MKEMKECEKAIDFLAAAVYNTGRKKSYCKQNMEVLFMTYTTAVKKEQLKGIIDTENLTDSVFKVIISPITQAEADEIEFKSLKGIADRPLDRDEVRKERLGL